MQEDILQDLWKVAQGKWESGVLPSADSLARARASLPSALPATGANLEAVQRHILDDIVPAFNGGSISANYYGFVGALTDLLMWHTRLTTLQLR